MKKFLVLHLAPASVVDEWKQTPADQRKAAEQKMQSEWKQWLGKHKKMFADNASAIHAGNLMTLHCASMLEQGKAKEARPYSSMAKNHVARLLCGEHRLVRGDQVRGDVPREGDREHLPRSTVVGPVAWCHAD